MSGKCRKDEADAPVDPLLHALDLAECLPRVRAFVVAVLEDETSQLPGRGRDRPARRVAPVPAAAAASPCGSWGLLLLPPSAAIARQNPTTCRMSTTWMRPGNSRWISRILPVDGRRAVLEWGHAGGRGHRRRRAASDREGALRCGRGDRGRARSRHSPLAAGRLPGALPCSWAPAGLGCLASASVRVRAGSGPRMLVALAPRGAWCPGAGVLSAVAVRGGVEAGTARLRVRPAQALGQGESRGASAARAHLPGRAGR